MVRYLPHGFLRRLPEINHLDNKRVPFKLPVFERFVWGRSARELLVEAIKSHIVRNTVSCHVVVVPDLFCKEVVAFMEASGFAVIRVSWLFEKNDYDLQELQYCLFREKPAAIVYPSFFGCDVPNPMKCEKETLLIADMAQAFPLSPRHYEDYDAVIYSFGPSKSFPALCGGIMKTRDASFLLGQKLCLADKFYLLTRLIGARLFWCFSSNKFMNAIACRIMYRRQELTEKKIKKKQKVFDSVRTMPKCLSLFFRNETLFVNSNILERRRRCQRAYVLLSKISSAITIDKNLFTDGVCTRLPILIKENESEAAVRAYLEQNGYNVYETDWSSQNHKLLAISLYHDFY